MKKIKLTIAKSYYYKLVTDAENFNLTANKLYNMIFYKTDILKLKSFDIKLKPEENQKISFNLNKKEEKKYNKIYDDIYDILNGNSLINLEESQKRNLTKVLETDASLFKTVFLKYLTMELSSDREIFLFKKSYQLINKAIENNKKAKILYKNNYRIIEPYFINTAENYPYNYIYSYCYKNKAFVTYLLSKIDKIELLYELWEQYDEKNIKAKKINFVRYETGNKIEDILIKFNEYGLDSFKIKTNNRPNNYRIIRENEISDIKLKYPDLKEIYLNKDEYIYEFKTSVLKVKLYFPQFLNNFEVLYPKSLRNYFKDKFEEAFRKHL